MVSDRPPSVPPPAAQLEMLKELHQETVEVAERLDRFKSTDYNSDIKHHNRVEEVRSLLPIQAPPYSPLPFLPPFRLTLVVPFALCLTPPAFGVMDSSSGTWLLEHSLLLPLPAGARHEETPQEPAPCGI